MAGGSMGLTNGSPTRISPTGQQGPMGSQLGGFPMGNTGPGGMGPSPPHTMSGLNAAQQANLANLTPHQRQQLLMLQQQQQQMMRSGNPNPNMMNNQMLNAMQQQQRMAQQQAGSSPHIGSPMLGNPTDGSNFPPALRSNPSVPGIARSTRTPSDHAPSPMTPQLSQMGNQRGMNQLAQGGGMGQMGGGMGGGNINTAWPQSQHNPQQMGQGQGGYGMSPPGSAGGFGGMPNASSPVNSQHWNQSGQISFSGGPMGGNQQLSDALGMPISRQTSATPAPQQQLQQNSPMGDQIGLNEFDIFNFPQ